MPNFSCIKQVSQEEIRKIIMKSPSKSCLLDPWLTFLVKECIDILLPSITRLVNCSLSEGVVPDEFKKAILTALIKKSSLPPNDLKNYRPVSGLGFISKLVERVVASQLNDHVSVNGLENVRHSAYKLGHSTESALLSIKNDFIWLLLKVRLLLSFSWINRQHLILLIMIRFLILSAPGLVSAGLSSTGSSLISQTVYSALR